MTEFDLPFAEVTATDVAACVERNGFAILRGALPAALAEWFRDDVLAPATAYWMGPGLDRLTTDPTIAEELNRFYGSPWPAPYYRDTAKVGIVNDRMLRCSTDGLHSFYDLMADPKLWRIAHQLAGPRLAPSISTLARAIDPMQRSGRFSEPVPWHIDYPYQQESLFVLNFWTPLEPAGPRAGASTLRIRRAPLRETVGALACGDDPVGVRDIEAAGVLDGEMVIADLAAGDMLLLTNWTVHQTYIAPGMTRSRTSAEVRMISDGSAFRALTR